MGTPPSTQGDPGPRGKCPIALYALYAYSSAPDPEHALADEHQLTQLCGNNNKDRCAKPVCDVLRLWCAWAVVVGSSSAVVLGADTIRRAVSRCALPVFMHVSVFWCGGGYEESRAVLM